jgi:complex iron-sulfur molybdoenzyme family reductase subunit gamma
MQTLVSYAFGTLSPASVQDVQGRGMRIGNDRWAVVFSKPYVSTGVDQATFSDGQTTDMAVAVWNGSEGDRNGRKSVSQFVTLSISPSDMAGTGNGGSTSGSLIAASGIFVVVAGLGAAFAAYGYRQGRSS